MNKNKKIIFIDAEFTGERQNTTLISLGIVTLDERELYITFNDYDKKQINPWLKKNVLSKIDKKNSINSKMAFKKINSFLKKYSQGKNIRIVSYGLTQDVILFYQLFKFKKKKINKNKFHFMKALPNNLRSPSIDLSTLFQVAGYKYNFSRYKYVGADIKNQHSSIYDARVARLCFLKLIKKGIFKKFASKI